MGMHHAMLMSGQNPAAAAAASSHGLNVGVASYMPMYQLPQIPAAPGGVGVGVGPAAPEHSADPAGGGGGVGSGGVEGKHGGVE